MTEHPSTPVDYVTRRSWLILAGFTCFGYLSGCKAQDRRPPKPPYGQALDVTQANTCVEFDFRIDKADRYDVVLEIFQKNPKERIPDEAWDVPNAHFKVRIESLAPLGEVILEQEVKKTKEPYGLFSRSFGASRTEKNNLMSEEKFLIYQQVLNVGTYRIHCDNFNPITALQDRLVKVSVERMHYPK